MSTLQVFQQTETKARASGWKLLGEPSHRPKSRIVRALDHLALTLLGLR